MVDKKYLQEMARNGCVEKSVISFKGRFVENALKSCSLWTNCLYRPELLGFFYKKSAVDSGGISEIRTDCMTTGGYH